MAHSCIIAHFVTFMLIITEKEEEEVQENPSNPDTNGTESVHISPVSLFQGCKNSS